MIHEYIYHENRFLICEEECIVKKRRFINRVVSFLPIFSLIIPNTVQFTVSAEESEKYPYSVFGRNGITMSASSNLCMNGNMHTNKNADISYLNGNINGRITTGNDIEKRVKHVYSDQKIMETYFTENCDLHEEEYVYSDMNIHINNPIFCYNNITLDGNVSLNSNLGSLMNINVTGEVKNANTSVVYSKYGDITIENDSTANINGLIYVPLGTLTINSPNINLNGVIIADKIVINGSSININYKDDIAQFIGNTSEVYDFSGLEYLPEEWLGDTDEDELFDIYEKVIDTDPFDSDTDDDGLPDGYEVINLNTDPLEIDTDENGISDADEDFDSDNLSNLGEYNHGTEPFNPDTDEDGFMDGDEVYTYGTEPLNPDTDNDGLLDGEESYDGSIYTKYGIYFDPLNPDTNGNGILDGDEVFGQSKKQEVETHDEAITEISVYMDTNGNLERNLTIESMYNVDAMSTNVYALIGEPFNFETPTSFNSATITFKIDQTKLGDTLFDNLIILWYNEEEQIFEEMETVHDEANSTVSTTTTHFSQYMIVDSEKWYANWEASFNELRKMWSANTSYYKALNTILIVDCSWKMRYADEISYSIEVGYNGVTEENYSEIKRAIDSEYNADFYMEKYGRRKCNRAYICENIINNMSNGDHIALIMYGSGIQSNTGLTGSYYPLMSSVQNVNNDGGTMYLSDAVSTALSYVTDDVENTYRIVIVTSGSVNYGSSLSAFDNSNVSLNIVSLGGGSISSEIESIAQGTGGDVYYGYPSSSLTGASGSSVTIPPQFIGEDSDGDGIPDIVELYGLKPNGQPIESNPEVRDTDGDGLEDNEELHFSAAKMTYELDKSQYDGSVFVWSDPCLKDTDWDSYDDKTENELGSNPLIANFYIESEDFEFVVNCDYMSNSYQYYYDGPLSLMPAYVWLGNYVFSSNYDKVELYKTAIVNYIIRTLNSNKTIYESQEWIELEKSIYEQYNDTVGLAYNILGTYGTPDITKRDMELIKDFQSKMRENLSIINSYGSDSGLSEGSIERIRQANLEFEYLSSQVDAVSKKINLKNMSIKFINGSIKGLSKIMDYTDWAVSAIDTYSRYVSFKSGVYMMEDAIELLEIFSKTDNVYVKQAALELLDYANTEYEKSYYEWIQAIQSLEEDAIGTGINIAIARLPEYGPYASLFLIVSDWATNISDTAEQAEYTYANSDISFALSHEIRSAVLDGEKLKNGYSISKDYKGIAKRFNDLIVLRINAEEQYIAYSKSYPWYSEWANINNQKIAESNINKLKNIMDKYFYEGN